MEQEAARAKVLEGATAVAVNHNKLVDKLFAAPGFPADELTDLFAGTTQDILTPGYEKGEAKLAMYAALAENMSQGKRFIAVVRVITTSIIEHYNAISRENGKKVKVAYLRIFEDVTPDKVKVVSDRVQGTFNTGEGKSAGIQTVRSVQIDHPSYIFTIGKTEFSESNGYDEEPTIFDGDPAHPPTYLGQMTEPDFPAQIFYADTFQELEDQLTQIGQDTDYQYGFLGQILAGNSEYSKLNNSMLS